MALQDYDQEGGHFDEHDGTSNAISSKLEPVELFNDEFGGKYAITTDKEDNVRVFCAEVIEHDNELEPFAMLNNTEENLNPSTRRKRIQKAPDQEDKDAITSTSADHQQLSKMIPDMVILNLII